MTVREAKEGRCKWAHVYVKTKIHWWLYVKADSGLSYTAETSALQGVRNWHRVIYTPGNRYPGGITLEHCRTSEEVATRWRDIIRAMDFYYLDPSLGGCVGFAVIVGNEMCNECP
jgi:hypothetical protein